MSSSLTKIPFIDLKREYKLIKPKINRAIDNVVMSGNFILGDEVEIFEKNISKYLGAKALSCASGSDSLLLSLMALDVKQEDEVITTPFSFVASASNITRLGARPVFVDIEDKTFNIDAKKIKKAITKRTKAIIVVHLFGNPADMDTIVKIAKKHKLAVIEDACQAIGAEYKGKRVGTIGDLGCFSFFPTKNLGGYGDGGLVVAKKKNHYDLIKKLRVQGADKKYFHEIIGLNSRLDTVQAAILNVKLAYLNKWNRERKVIARKYSTLLKDVIVVPQVDKDCQHVFHQYAILSKNRDKLLNYLHKNGIAAGVYYPMPLHLQKCFSYLGYHKGDLPITEKVSREIISLPIFPGLREEEVKYVARAVKEFIHTNYKSNTNLRMNQKVHKFK